LKGVKILLSDLTRGDIVLVTLPSHQPHGREQEGQRPAIIVGIPQGKVRYPIIVIAPLTTQIGDWAIDNPDLYPRLEVGMGGLSRVSIVLLDQLRALDARRVVAYLGTLTEEQFKVLAIGLKQVLGFI
jgi:mRNA interferase MazF